MLQMLPQPSTVSRAEPKGEKVEWVCLAGVEKGLGAHLLHQDFHQQGGQLDLGVTTVLPPH